LTRRIITAGVFTVLAAAISHGQIGKITQQDWVTSRGDAQRSSWIRGDAAISPESMQKPGFELQWMTRLDNQSRQLNALAGGVVMGNLGFGSIPVSFVTGSADRLYAIDNDTGALQWQRTLDDRSVPLLDRRSLGEGGQPDPGTAAGTLECPGGITAAATRPTTVVPSIPTWRGLPARVEYSSGVGSPGEGVPAYLLGRGATGRAGAAPAPAPVTAAARAGGAPVAAAPSPPLPQVVYALSSGGLLHTLGPYSGKDLARPLPFLPPGAHATDLIAVNNTVYAATTNGCAGVADGVWAIDLAGDAKAVKAWRTNGGSPSGPPSFGTDGTLYAAIGPRSATGSGGFANAIVALDPKELTVKDWFIQPGVDFVASPVVFKVGERDIVAAAARDGSIVLLDGASLGGPTRETALHRSAAVTDRSSFVPAGLATWEDSAGTRWLLMPSATKVIAMKVTSTGSSVALAAGWVSRDMRAPLTPIVVNGVAFVVSSGEYVAPIGARVSAADRARQSVPATLYALDAATGRELWTSGSTITSFAHRSALWPGIGQIHVATYDNAVYAFGFPLERY
jgi:outer membrane protein assembly factor BamB